MEDRPAIIVLINCFGRNNYDSQQRQLKKKEINEARLKLILSFRQLL